MAPLFEELVRRYPTIRFLKVNVDQLPVHSLSPH
jgi:thiol-disulfide isomerase/thioredoxin